jgi:hypothetical protein
MPQEYFVKLNIRKRYHFKTLYPVSLQVPSGENIHLLLNAISNRLCYLLQSCPNCRQGIYSGGSFRVIAVTVDMKTYK